MNAKEYARLVAVERAADRALVRAGYAHRAAFKAVCDAERELQKPKVTADLVGDPRLTDILRGGERLIEKVLTWPRLK